LHPPPPPRRRAAPGIPRPKDPRALARMPAVNAAGERERGREDPERRGAEAVRPARQSDGGREASSGRHAGTGRTAQAHSQEASLAPLPTPLHRTAPHRPDAQLARYRGGAKKRARVCGGGGRGARKREGGRGRHTARVRAAPPACVTEFSPSLSQARPGGRGRAASGPRCVRVRRLQEETLPLRARVSRRGGNAPAGPVAAADARGPTRSRHHDGASRIRVPTPRSPRPAVTRLPVRVRTRLRAGRCKRSPAPAGAGQKP
jgi:hypothetical protein